ncbi:MAG: type II toxin-antitoxin system VapB family antitoxin [Armatimonadetes bacterium]|nr:type II toxin-antitoxin system VapB family antitoxin [Armatimonadota bacterium]
MALNIKNEETARVVAQLAEATGTSLTEAIRIAVTEKLERMQSLEEKVERILAIGRDSAARMSAQTKAVDHGDLLYGEDGLPK